MTENQRVRAVRHHNYNPPKNMTQALASAPILAALMLGGIGYELGAWLVPDLQLLIAIGGFVIGIAVGFIAIKRYINRVESTPRELTQGDHDSYHG